MEMKEKMYSLVLKGGNVFPINRILDVGIKNGKIAEVATVIPAEEAEEVIDISGQTVLAGFVDAHLHMDMALTADEEDAEEIFTACVRADHCIADMYQGWNKDDMLADIMERYEKLIHMCVVNGTTAIKNHITVSDSWDMHALEAAVRMKEKYSDLVTIKNIVPFFPDFEEKFREACEQGHVDFIGGYPNHQKPENGTLVNPVMNGRQLVDKIFELSREYDIPMDFTVDESDSDNIEMFNYIVKKTYAEHMEGRVNCTHVTAMSAKGIDEDYVADSLAWAAKARVQVATATGNDMYLMDIGRRGPTRVRQMLDAGVDVSLVSENIRDTFRPFGNGDLLDEALLTAQVHKLFTRSELLYVARMITILPAQNMMLQDYGVTPGCHADLVVLEAPDIQEAILSQADKTYVLKNGRIIAKSGQLI